MPFFRFFPHERKESAPGGTDKPANPTGAPRAARRPGTGKRHPRKRPRRGQAPALRGRVKFHTVPHIGQGYGGTVLTVPYGRVRNSTRSRRAGACPRRDLLGDVVFRCRGGEPPGWVMRYSLSCPSLRGPILSARAERVGRKARQREGLCTKPPFPLDSHPPKPAGRAGFTHYRARSRPPAVPRICDLCGKSRRGQAPALRGTCGNLHRP